jgi:hypothetical protein
VTFSKNRPGPKEAASSPVAPANRKSAIECAKVFTVNASDATRPGVRADLGRDREDLRVAKVSRGPASKLCDRVSHTPNIGATRASDGSSFLPGS